MHGRPDIRAVIFDMDGVLTDSEPLINAAAIAVFREKGLTVQPDDFLPFVGTGEDRYIGGVAEKYGFPLDLPAAKKRTYEIYLDLVPVQLRGFPGAAALVETCRKNGLKVGVASSADRIKIDANLVKIGLPSPTWDAVVSGDDAPNKKPAPDLFLAAAARLGLPAAECVVVEDAINGIQAAKAAGMRCIAVAQTFPPERLQGADVVRSTIAEVTVRDLIDGPEPAAGAPPIIPAADDLPPIIAPQPAEPPIIEGQNAPPMLQAEAARPWGFWATLGMGIFIAMAFVAVQAMVGAGYALMAMMAGKKVVSADLETNGLMLGVATCVSAPVTVVLSWILASLRPGLPARQYLAVRGTSFKALVFWSFALALVIVSSDLLTRWLGRPLVPDFMHRIYATAGFKPLLWFALVVAAPIAEETLFRGFLFAGFRHSPVGLTGAILLPSLAWAGIHVQYDLYGMGTIFMTGLLLGLARWRTDSLLAPICLHALMNLAATFETALGFGQ